MILYIFLIILSENRFIIICIRRRTAMLIFCYYVRVMPNNWNVHETPRVHLCWICFVSLLVTKYKYKRILYTYVRVRVLLYLQLLMRIHLMLSVNSRGLSAEYKRIFDWHQIWGVRESVGSIEIIELGFLI